MENIPQKIFVKDVNSVYISCNEKFARDLKIAPKEIRGKTDYDFFPRGLAEKYREDDRRIIKKGRTEDIEEEYFIVGKGHAEGRKIVVHTVKTPIRGRDGNIVGVLGIFRDITEHREMEEELRKYQKSLERLVSERTAQLEKANAKLREEIKERMQAEKTLKAMTIRDPHTGLFNYRFFKETVDSEFSRARRYAQPLSMIFIDIDYFKSINEVYGHQFGDVVLKQFGAWLKKAVRKSDLVFRYGGEEFIILAPGVGRKGMMYLAGRLLEKVRLRHFGTKKRAVKLKISIGVSSYPEDKINTASVLMDTADKALNITKERGGNRVSSSLEIARQKNIFSEDSKDTRQVRLLKKKIGKLANRASQSVIEAILAFAKTIELKDYYTGRHVEKTVRYAEEIARALNLPDKQVDDIVKAATLHDLGKIGVSEAILRKKTKLTKKEYEEIKKHSEIGADIIRPIHFLRDLVPLIRCHHERWDGRGYPDGLKKKEIPLGARIISVADAYQALTSRRSYRKAYSKNEAVRILKKESGLKYDPEMVGILLKILRKK